MVSPLSALTTSTLPKHFFTASLLSYPYIIGNPAIHPAALALVTYEVDDVSIPVTATPACCYFIFPAPLGFIEFDCPCLQHLLLYNNSIPPLHSSTLHRCAGRTGSRHKAEQVSFIVIGHSPQWSCSLGLHACRPAPSKPYYNLQPCHGQLLGLENGEHTVLRQRTICLVRPLFRVPLR